MNKIHTLSAALVLVGALFPVLYAASEPKTYQLQTSVIRLIAAPEEHYDKNIVVDGIFIGYSENNLFFDERHTEYLLRPMSINVLDDSEDEEGSLSVSMCNGEWVELWGTFIKAVDTDVSYFKGRLVVDKAVLHKNGDTCWQRTKPSFLEQRK